MKEYELTSDYIELNKLLKICGLAATGGQAGLLVTEGAVTVNGRKEFRKRAKLRKGDIVTMEGVIVKIV